MEETGDENKEEHLLGDECLIQYKILLNNKTRVVRQTLTQDFGSERIKKLIEM